MDDEFNSPVKFKGAKCIFFSRGPTRAELDPFQNFYMTSHNDSVNICDLRKYLEYIKMT